MTIEEYAYLVEILGSIAVVISLIFVGVQLARANRESRAATMQAAYFRNIVDGGVNAGGICLFVNFRRQ